MSVSSSLVVTCCERADLFALLFLMFYCIFVTFPYGVVGQVWYLIVPIPDLCLLPFYFLIIYLVFTTLHTGHAMGLHMFSFKYIY